MCCSRVCSASRNALFPWASTETPTIRPGMDRLFSCFVAMYAACGPPNPSGTPNRWALPITTSAPNSPGATRTHRDKRSAATATSRPASWWPTMGWDKSATFPDAPGYWYRTPKQLSCALSGSPISTWIPIAAALVWTTEIVCGKQSESTKNTFSGPPWSRLSIVIASAAAVASSSREALAMSQPVKSQTIVWKLSNASNLPWDISAW